MVALFPTSAQIVGAEWTSRVPSPAYDSLTPAQRRAWRVDHPDSYLNVTRSPEDELPGAVTAPHDLVTAGRDALDRIVAAGAFVESQAPALYLYRLSTSEHTQVGIVGEVAVADYANGDIRIHEEIRPARAELLADHFETVGAASSPVALAFRNRPEIADLMDGLISEPAALDFEDDSGLRQTVWCISDQLTIATLTDALSAEPAYIIDGHHRAAASLTAEQRTGKSEPDNHMFVALFPDDGLQLLGFNRWLRVDVDQDELIAHLGSVTDSLDRVEGAPELERGVVGVYAKGSWFRAELAGVTESSYDVFTVRDRLIGPVFGIDAADDARLVNVASDQSVDELVALVDAEGGVAITIAPIELDAFMAAADRGVILPPKSTYFTPKVRSGVFMRPNR